MIARYSSLRKALGLVRPSWLIEGALKGVCQLDAEAFRMPACSSGTPAVDEQRASRHGRPIELINDVGLDLDTRCHGTKI